MRSGVKLKQRSNWGLVYFGARTGKEDLTLTLAAGFSHLYHVDSFNSSKLNAVPDRVMEDTNVSPGSQYLTRVHNLYVNISMNAYVWPYSSV